MKENMGSADRTIRMIAAIAIGVLLLTGQMTGGTALVFGILAVVLLSTSMIRFCPLYVPFKISTDKGRATHPD